MDLTASPPGPADTSADDDVPAERPLKAGATLRKLVLENLDFVWRSLRRFGVTDADADDATQRVFLIASGKLAMIRTGSERAFLVGTAARVAAHSRRSYRRREAAEQRFSSTPPPPNPDPEELTQKRED